MFPYEGPQNALRSRVKPPTHNLERLPDLPMKQDRGVASGPSVRKADAETKVKQSAQKRKSPVKKPPSPMKTEQPRDHLGRFARKAGAVIWGAAKGTVKAVKGTSKAVESVHRTVKRVQANARRRAALEHRERKLDLHKREIAAGLKRPRTTRRKSAPQKKKGGLFGFLGGSQKKQIRRKR